MEDLEQLIYAAWKRIKPRLEDEPALLAARIQRRRTPTLMRPPRAWCIALRACDHRIPSPAAPSSVHHSSFIDHRSHFSSDPEEHQVTLYRPQLIKLTQPVQIDWPGEPAVDVAKKLGTTAPGILTARCRNLFRTRYHLPTGGHGGKLVPYLFTEKPLDPCAVNFAEPDPVWLRTTNLLGCYLPDGFHATLTRVPAFRSHVSRDRYNEFRHTEVDAVPKKSKSKALPPPPPDPFHWYKFSLVDDHFLGTDPANWRKNFQDPGDRPRRDLPPKDYSRRTPRKSEAKSTGSLHFNGFRWRCPHCQKLKRVLYFPLKPFNLLGHAQPRIAQCVDVLRGPAQGTFACAQCHRVRFASSITGDYWNDVITYLTAGLLYGREVPRPEWAVAQRKNQYAPRPTRAPSVRRPQVLELLLQGRSYAQIGQELGLSKRTINDYATIIYKQNNVAGKTARVQLAKKLNRPAPPKKPSRREEIQLPKIQTLPLEGKTHKRIGQELGLSPRTVNDYICILYRKYGVKGHHAREALAEKLNHKAPPDVRAMSRMSRPGRAEADWRIN